MRPPFVLTSVLCGLLISLSGRGEVPASAVGGQRGHLAIEVDRQGWGAVDPDDIRTVLYSVADTLLTRIPEHGPLALRVSHTHDTPAALYDRGPGGEYLIRLHADRDRWPLYVYEFAHELCHILSNYDRAGAEIRRRNQWLEETLCETASLYALGSLGTQWEYAPPEAHLAPHAADLRRFFRFLVTEQHRKLPEEIELDEWLQEHEAHLCADPYQRDKNDLVARTLLPLFFIEPDGWDAIAYLNLDAGDALASLDDFLRHWYAHTPQRHRPFVARISALLSKGAVPSEPSRSAATAPATPADPSRP